MHIMTTRSGRTGWFIMEPVWLSVLIIGIALVLMGMFMYQLWIGKWLIDNIVYAVFHFVTLLTFWFMGSYSIRAIPMKPSMGWVIVVVTKTGKQYPTWFQGGVGQLPTDYANSRHEWWPWRYKDLPPSGDVVEIRIDVLLGLEQYRYKTIKV